MTIEAFTPAALALIQTQGPFAIPHPYADGAIVAVVLSDAGVRTVLSPSDYTLTPEASTDTGDLMLTPEAFAAHAGKQLAITRATPQEQGWEGRLGEREKGLERQLDLMTMAIQDQGGALARTIRLDYAVPVLAGAPNTLIGLDDAGFPVAVPRITDATAAAFVSRAAAQAATVPVAVALIEVLHAGRVFTYRRTTANTTLAALATNGGTVFWEPLPAGGAGYDPAAWGSGWEALRKCWYWQVATNARVHLSAWPGDEFTQPTGGAVQDRVLIGQGIPVWVRMNGARVFQQAAEPWLAVSPGFSQVDTVTALTTGLFTETVDPNEGDDEDGDEDTATFDSDQTRITIADVSGYERGDIIKIRDDRFTPLDEFGDPVLDGGDLATPGMPAHKLRRRGEFATVAKVDRTNNRLILFQPLRFAYDTAANCRIGRLRRAQIDIADVRVETTANRHPGLTARNDMMLICNAIAPRVSNIVTPFSGGHVAHFYECWQPQSRDFAIQATADHSVAPEIIAGVEVRYLTGRYGIRNTNCTGGVHSGHVASQCRHLIDFLASGAQMPSWLQDPEGRGVLVNGTGACFDANVSNCLAIGMSSASFATHDGTMGVTFTGCTSISPRRTSFGLRGRGNRLVGCRSVNAQVDVRLFIHNRYEATAAVVSDLHLIQGLISENPRGVVIRVDQGVEHVKVDGLQVTVTDDYSGNPTYICRIDTAATVTIDNLNYDCRVASALQAVFYLPAIPSGETARVHLFDSQIVSRNEGPPTAPGAFPMASLVLANGAGTVQYALDNVRAWNGPQQGQLVEAICTGTAIAAVGSHMHQSRVVGLWSQDAVAPSRAVAAAGRVSADLQTLAYLQDGQRLDFSRAPALLATEALELADGSRWMPAAGEYSPRHFGAIAAVDDTDAVRQCCLAASQQRRPITFAGIPRIAVEADAQIEVWTSMYGHGCQIAAVNGIRPAPNTWNMVDARVMFQVRDPDTPVQVGIVPVSLGSLTAGSFTPILDYFGGPGYYYMQGAAGSTDLIHNRDRTGTLTYRQPFRATRTGRVSLPLARGLPGTTSIRVERRLMSDRGALSITGFVFDFATFNNQMFFRVQRNAVWVTHLSGINYNLHPEYNANALVKAYQCCDVVFRDWVMEAIVRLPAVDASYIYSTEEVAGVSIENIRAEDGWGAHGGDMINGLRVHNCTVNRVDVHGGAFNISVSDCTLTERGVTVGWGGGYLKVQNCVLYNTAIQVRDDYGSEFFGADWQVTDCLVEDADFEGAVVQMLNLGGPLMATPAPNTISIANITRTARPGAGSTTASLRLLSMTVRTNAVSVIAPKAIALRDSLTSQRTTVCATLGLADMDPSDGATIVALSDLTSSRDSTGDTNATLLVPAPTKTVPAARVGIELVAVGCNALAVQAGEAGAGGSYKISACDLGRLQTPANVQCMIRDCDMSGAIRYGAETQAPLGNGSTTSASSHAYVSLVGCQIGDHWNLSSVLVADANHQKSGHLTNMTYPAGQSATTFRTGFGGTNIA